MRKMIWTLGATALLAAAACTDTPIHPQRQSRRAARSSDNSPVSDGHIFQSNGVTAACVATEWHWVINGLASATLAPTTITVHFAGGDVVVPFDKFTGGTAHYTWTGNLLDQLVAPYAETYLLPGGTFYNRFDLSHGPCNTPDDHPQGSQINTQVHLADHSVIDKDVKGPLGSTVHDKATVTADADIPANS